MKEVIRLTALSVSVAALIVTANIWAGMNSTTAPVSLSSEELSWIEFCKARHYDSHTQDPEIINEYLDTWCGSVEEERAFNNLEALHA